LSNVAGEILVQVVAEVAARVIVGAIEAGIRSSFAPPAPPVPEQVRVQFPAAIEAEGDGARIGRECGIDESVVTYTLRSLARHVTALEIDDPARAGSASLLKLTIVDIDGRSNGRTSRTWMTVRADFLQDGAVVSSKEFRHFSPSASPDTCKVVNRIARPIGKDAARWVQGELNVHARAPVAPPSPPRRTALYAPAAIETIAIRLQAVDTSEADPTTTLVEQLRGDLVARGFKVASADEADALLVIRHDSNKGRATTVELALVERATGIILWTGRSTNGQLSAEAAKWAATAAVRTMPPRAAEP